MKLTQEMMEKARAAKTAEDLLLLANENGISITAQEADIYLAQLHPTDGELADNELDDDLLDGVAGGWIVGGAGQENSSEVLRKKSTRSQCG